jgi:hypothetical protein
MHLSVIGNPDASVDQVLTALDKRERLRELALSRAAFLNPKQLRYAYDEAFGLSPGERA